MKFFVSSVLVQFLEKARRCPDCNASLPDLSKKWRGFRGFFSPYNRYRCRPCKCRFHGVRVIPIFPIFRIGWRRKKKTVTICRQLAVTLVVIAVLLIIAILAADSFSQKPSSTPADPPSAGFFILNSPLVQIKNEKAPHQRKHGAFLMRGSGHYSASGTGMAMAKSSSS
jgi:hypothetical protein